MKSIEKTGKNVDQAITRALIELGASKEEVEIEVIAKGSKGILGIGAKEAKVRVTIKEEFEVKEEVKPVVEEARLKVEDAQIQQDKAEEQSVNAEVKDSEDSIIVSPEEIDDVIKRAEAFLNKLLKEMNVECSIDAQIINNNRINISLQGKNMGIIIGKRGETLDAIQYITNIVANKERTEYIKIMLDTENYRARREETLRKLAFKLSKKAQQTRRPVILEPMNPYDRRIIHSALQDNKYVKTHSEGREPFRKVVITPNYQHRTHRTQ